MESTRRIFLSTMAAAPFVSAAAPGRLPIKKAVYWSMIRPANAPILDKFKMAKEAGFEEIELPTTPEKEKAQEMLAASKTTGIRIHSVMNSDHWRFPLSSADPSVVEKCMEGMRTSLRNAQMWGADTVLLVPAVVNPETSYQEAWTRSQKKIKELIPLAQECKVVIGVEEVWNKFLLSPLEMAKYIDEFNSPWVKAYFDVGNVAFYGYPHDWIRTLGKRIAKLHFKDFSYKQGQTKFDNLGEGQIDFLAVHAALKDIGYKGTATLELSGGDANYLKDVSNRFENILSGEKIKIGA
jgi:hexulose-6-phosphate isomerase